MARYTLSRSIDASVSTVFDTVSDVRNFSKAVANIEDIEFLSDAQTGVGTRFRETRNMNGRKASTELEVTEYVADERIRLVSEAGGTTWDTVFTVKGSNGGPTELTMVMDATPHGLLARLSNLLIGGMMRRALAGDMDAVKAYCEAGPVVDDGHDVAASSAAVAHEE